MPLHITTKISKVFAPRKKGSIAFEFATSSRDYLERPDWSHDILNVKKAVGKLTRKLQLNKHSRSPEMNVYGRTFRVRKSLVKDMRSLIIDVNVRGGGDVSFYPRSFTAIGKKNTKLVVIQFQKYGGRFVKQLEMTFFVTQLRVNRKSWKNQN